MSEQGKRPTFWTIRDKEHWEEKEQLRYRLTTAETAATEYAKQAAELQEEVERLRGASLVLANWVADTNSSRADEMPNSDELSDSAYFIIEALAETETE